MYTITSGNGIKDWEIHNISQSFPVPSKMVSNVPLIGNDIDGYKVDLHRLTPVKELQLQYLTG